MFPFQIQQFHSDNGLVESKNGCIIRKHFGYIYIESTKASIINTYLKKYFNEYLNFHRTCAYPTKQEDKSNIQNRRL